MTWYDGEKLITIYISQIFEKLDIYILKLTCTNSTITMLLDVRTELSAS